MIGRMAVPNAHPSRWGLLDASEATLLREIGALALLGAALILLGRILKP